MSEAVVNEEYNLPYPAYDVVFSVRRGPIVVMCFPCFGRTSITVRTTRKHRARFAERDAHRVHEIVEPLRIH
jgi:hypothetical protein